MIEKYPLRREAEAYEQMDSGKVQFRVILAVTRNGAGTRCEKLSPKHISFFLADSLQEKQYQKMDGKSGISTN